MSIIPKKNLLVFSLPNCPTPSFKIPLGTTILQVCIAATGLFCGTLALLYYNSVTVGGIRKKIRNKSVSNTLWGVYFVLVGLRGIVNCMRYLDPFRFKHYLYESITSFISMLLHATTALFLTFALNFQLKYRSNYVGWARKLLYAFDFSSFFFYLLTLGFIITQLFSEEKWVGWVLFSCVIAQRLPIYCILLMFVIPCLESDPIVVVDQAHALHAMDSEDEPTEDDIFVGGEERQGIMTEESSFQHQDVQAKGPRIFVRLLALLALCFHLPNEIPLMFYYSWFENVFTTCIYYIGHPYDTILLGYLISIIIWFLLMRQEYLRCQEETMYNAYVRQTTSEDILDDEMFRAPDDSVSTITPPTF